MKPDLPDGDRIHQFDEHLHIFRGLLCHHFALSKWGSSLSLSKKKVLKKKGGHRGLSLPDQLDRYFSLQLCQQGKLLRASAGKKQPAAVPKSFSNVEFPFTLLPKATEGQRPLCKAGQVLLLESAQQPLFLNLPPRLWPSAMQK